jgi:hypothetical protein
MRAYTCALTEGWRGVVGGRDMLRIGVDFGTVVFFFAAVGPRREEAIVEFVRCVPGPGEFFEVVERVWPGIANVGMAIAVVVNVDSGVMNLCLLIESLKGVILFR